MKTNIRLFGIAVIAMIYGRSGIVEGLLEHSAEWTDGIINTTSAAAYNSLVTGIVSNITAELTKKLTSSLMAYSTEALYEALERADVKGADKGAALVFGTYWGIKLQQYLHNVSSVETCPQAHELMIFALNNFMKKSPVNHYQLPILSLSRALQAIYDYKHADKNDYESKRFKELLENCEYARWCRASDFTVIKKQLHPSIAESLNIKKADHACRKFIATVRKANGKSPKLESSLRGSRDNSEMSSNGESKTDGDEEKQDKEKSVSEVEKECDNEDEKDEQDEKDEKTSKDKKNEENKRIKDEKRKRKSKKHDKPGSKP